MVLSVDFNRILRHPPIVQTDRYIYLNESFYHKNKLGAI